MLAQGHTANEWNCWDVDPGSEMPDTGPCSHPVLSLLLLPLRGKPQVGKGPGSHSPLHGEKKTLEIRRRGQERVGAPGVLFKGRGDATHPGPLGKGGGDSCIQLRLWKGHGGESSHCVPQESGGREPLSQDTVLCPGPPPQSQEALFFWGGVRDWLSACLAVLRES